MGRSRKSELAQVSTNTIVASAARLGAGAKSYSQISSAARGWQNEAWRFYRLVGEFRYACDWVGSMLSKATLHATLETSGKVEHLTDGAAAKFVESLFGDTDGKTEMLRLIGIHMTVAGELFIVGHPNGDNPALGDKWQVVAATRLRNSGSDDDPNWHINGKRIDIEDHSQVLVVRVWRQDPEDPELAISPARAVLTTLGEIYKLTEHVNAQVDSRLAGAGILLVPSEMTMPAAPDTIADDGSAVRHSASTADELIKVLNATMAKAIDDRGHASALVPIVITAPGEVVDKVKHLTFWTELDSHAIDLRNEAIRRLALGMDMPPEVLQGASESNHWSAWQSDESAIKSHTEPLLKIITSALAEGYLRPLLIDEPSIDGLVEHYSIGADTSELRQRPNRSKEALELHQMGLLSDKALLRETGFDPEADGLDAEAQKVWFLRRLASGSTTPAQVEAAMRILFPGLPLNTEKTPLESEIEDEEGTEARPQPSLKDHPVRDVPNREISERRKIAREEGRVPSATGGPRLSVSKDFVGFLANGSDMLVVRALERAGNRIKSGMKVAPAFAAVDLYKTVKVEDAEDLLKDAWSHVPRLAERFGMNPDTLTAVLHEYTADLLLTRKDHSYDALLEHMTNRIEGAAA